MINLQQLPSLVKHSAKRLGRGYGSGKGGHTSGRGSKGKKARGKVGLLFEGTKNKKSLLRRLPVWRGRNNRGRYIKVPVSLDWLERKAKPGTIIDLAFLRRHKKIKGPDYSYKPKVVFQGRVTKALKVALPITKNAAAAIIKAGGQVIAVKEKEHG